MCRICHAPLQNPPLGGLSDHGRRHLHLPLSGELWPALPGGLLRHSHHHHVWHVRLDGEPGLPAPASRFVRFLPPFSNFPLLWSPQYVFSQPNQGDVVKGIFLPWCQNCSRGAVEQGLGVVGAVIMPHNLYLHSGLVLVSCMSCECHVTLVITDCHPQSRAISRRSTVDIKEGIKYNSIESSMCAVEWPAGPLCMTGAARQLGPRA